MGDYRKSKSWSIVHKLWGYYGGYTHEYQWIK